MNVANLHEARAALERHTIEVQAGELSRMVAQAQAALIATQAGIYQRGGQLVRIAALERDTVQHGVRRSAGSVVILTVTRDYLPLALGRAAYFRRYDKRERAQRRIDPPAAVSSAMIASAGEWTFPSLAGIVTAPTLRSDASLLERPGYDAESRLYAAFDPEDFPPINPKPSRAEADAALELLDELFSECAFAGGAHSPHASVALAASISACVRHALPIAPAFALSAHKAGSGKTTTAKVPAQLATGRDPAITGPIGAAGSITAGSSYTDGTYTDVPLTGGSGSFARATIVVSGGAVILVSITDGGFRYALADTLSAAAASMGGSGSGFEVAVSNLSRKDALIPQAWINQYKQYGWYPTPVLSWGE